MYYTIKIIAIFGAIIAVLNFLPQLLIPETAYTSLSSALSFAYQFNHIVDIASIVTIILLFLTIESIFILWRTFKGILFLIK